MPLTSHGLFTYFNSVNFCQIEKRKNKCLIFFQDLQNYVNGIFESKCLKHSYSRISVPFYFFLTKLYFATKITYRQLDPKRKRR